MYDMINLVLYVKDVQQPFEPHPMVALLALGPPELTKSISSTGNQHDDRAHSIPLEISLQASIS